MGGRYRQVPGTCWLDSLAYLVTVSEKVYITLENFSVACIQVHTLVYMH